MRLCLFGQKSRRDESKYFVGDTKELYEKLYTVFSCVKVGSWLLVASVFLHGIVATVSLASSDNVGDANCEHQTS